MLPNSLQATEISPDMLPGHRKCRLCFLKPAGLEQRKIIRKSSSLSFQKNSKMFVLFSNQPICCLLLSVLYVPIIYASPFSTDRMAQQQTVISEVVRVLPSMKQLEVKLERKSQNLVPRSLHLMTMVLRIQIIRMRITHRLWVEHQLDSLLGMQGKPWKGKNLALSLAAESFVGKLVYSFHWPV